MNPSEGPPLANNSDHFNQCHARWRTRLHRDQSPGSYKDEWYAQQCLHCRYFVPLTGAFALDYGACTNPASPCDATVRFEHDGCDEFAAATE
jgi:hypothetical protein